MEGYSNILLAVDFSKDTELLTQRAADIAQRYAAMITLVHVVEPAIIDPSYDVFPALPLGLEQEQIDKSRQALVSLGARFNVVAERCHLLVGSTKTEILRLARDGEMDLIVVGSHGRHGVALLLGSTANAILHGAPCDVLAIRVH